MKCLIIKNGKGYYSLNGTDEIPLDNLSKEDLLKILNLIVTGMATMDEYDETAVLHTAHKIIYKNLYEKFKELEINKARFRDESTSLYREAIDKYNVELRDENDPYKV